MKNVKKISIVILLFIIYTYVCYISFLPSSYIIMQGEELKITTLLGTSLTRKSDYTISLDGSSENNSQTLQTSSDEATLQTASSLGKKVNEIGKIDFNLKLFNLFNVKNVSVNVIPKTSVVPVRRGNRNEVIYRWCFSSRHV